MLSKHALLHTHLDGLRVGDGLLWQPEDDVRSGVYIAAAHAWARKKGCRVTCRCQPGDDKSPYYVSIILATDSRN